MNKLKTILFHITLGFGIWCAAFGCAEAQTKAPADKISSIDWLRNNVPTVSDGASSYDYNEDAYYGIERFDKRVPRDDNEISYKNYSPRDGNGEGTGSGIGNGNGVGSGSANNSSPSIDSWIPYYHRPSNCATADYQPVRSQNLPDIDETIKNRSAQIIYQPRPLYSKLDYIAGREGTIKINILLKADGTVGSVRPLTRLSGNLTESATRAACYLTFYPALNNGKAVDSTKTVVYSFKTDQVDRTAYYPPPPAATAPLKIISKPRPVYTPEARENQIQGVVTLRVTFLASGKIGKIVPITGLADGLTAQAIEAAKLIKFEPARIKGRSFTQTKTIAYNFTVY